MLKKKKDKEKSEMKEEKSEMKEEKSEMKEEKNLRLYERVALTSKKALEKKQKSK